MANAGTLLITALCLMVLASLAFFLILLLLLHPLSSPKLMRACSLAITSTAVLWSEDAAARVILRQAV